MNINFCLKQSENKIKDKSNIGARDGVFCMFVHVPQGRVVRTTCGRCQAVNASAHQCAWRRGDKDAPTD